MALWCGTVFTFVILRTQGTWNHAGEMARNSFRHFGTSITQNSERGHTVDNVVFLTVGEVAKIFRVSKMTVYRMCETGEIYSTRVGKSVRIHAGELANTHPVTAEQIAAVILNK